VGIGLTSTSNYQLDVSGTTLFRSIYIENNGNNTPLDVSGVSILEGSVSIGKNTAPSYSLDVNGVIYGNRYLLLNAPYTNNIEIFTDNTSDNDNKNIIIGSVQDYDAVNQYTSYNNVLIGADNPALYVLNSISNIGIGTHVFASGVGDGSNMVSNNIAIGYNAMTTNTKLLGSENIGIGTGTFSDSHGDTTLNHNIAIGCNALTSTNSSNNIAIGYNSGTKLNQSYKDGTNNIFIGTDANTDGNNPYSNSIALGYNSTINNSNQIVLGTSAETIYFSGTDTSGIVIGIDTTGMISPNEDGYIQFSDGSTMTSALWTQVPMSNNIYTNLNVGIGTSNPTNTLEVGGNTKINGNLDTSNLGVSGNFNINGNMDVSGVAHINTSVNVFNSTTPNTNVVITPSSIKLTDGTYTNIITNNTSASIFQNLNTNSIVFPVTNSNLSITNSSFNSSNGYNYAILNTANTYTISSSSSNSTPLFFAAIGAGGGPGTGCYFQINIINSLFCYNNGGGGGGEGGSVSGSTTVTSSTPFIINITNNGKVGISQKNGNTVYLDISCNAGTPGGTGSTSGASGGIGGAGGTVVGSGTLFSSVSSVTGTDGSQGSGGTGGPGGAISATGGAGGSTGHTITMGSTVLNYGSSVTSGAGVQGAGQTYTPLSQARTYYSSSTTSSPWVVVYYQTSENVTIDGNNGIQINNLSLISTTSHTTASGYLQINVDGNTRYIPLYT
jgi:hypothetical protein